MICMTDIFTPKSHGPNCSSTAGNTVTRSGEPVQRNLAKRNQFSRIKSTRTAYFKSSPPSYLIHHSRVIRFFMPNEMCWIRTLLLYSFVLSSSLIISASTAKDTASFLYDLQSQCPPWIFQKPLAVDGNFLDEVLNTRNMKGYTSILFHASWCPFSIKLFNQFETLSFIFPHIEHLTVEQSSALPSVFSRNGIHSLPSIILVNKTTKLWFYGPKNLDSISHFYENITRQKPLTHNFIDLIECESCVEQRLNWPSMKEDPFLVFAVMFVVMRLIILLAPSVHHHVNALHLKYTPQFQLEALFERGFHMVDVRRMWGKMRMCKTRGFQEKAKSCRLWASSLASASSRRF